MSCRFSVLEMIFCQKLSHFLERSAYTAVGARGEKRQEATEFKSLSLNSNVLAPNLPSLKEP